ncbi:phosphopantetheine-binding protein, partial [Streptomyces sp. NPDC086519]|uniref:phosphopantetheine-binding protein n=1 Tax=Streptomyces sp. NPDC086519 TaxID=3154863 RepID=UPI00342B33FA
MTTNQPHGTPADRDALIAEFLRTSREMVAAQRDVLLTYFGATQVQVPAAPVLQQLPPAEVLAPQPQPAKPAVAAASVAEPEAAADVERVVLEIISERTGYPVDMIEPDLDLEADLSIDSIKRAEIAGELAKRLGIAGGAETLDDAELEDLAKARTAAAVTGWLKARVDAGGAGPAPAATGTPGDGHDAGGVMPVPGPAAAKPAGGGGADPDPGPGTGEPLAGVAPKRFVLRPVALAEPDAEADPGALLASRRFVLLGAEAGPAAAQIAARLAACGAETVTLPAGHLLGAADGTVDGVLYLGGLPGAAETPVLPDAFPALRAALARGPRWLLAVRPADGADAARSAGLHGLFRTVAREYPDTVARVVTLGDTAPNAVADALLAELLAPEPAPVVLRTAAGRQGLDMVEAAPGALGGTGAGPAGAGAAEAAALGLDRDSVVLLVGGARGITAKFAATLAGACRCRI